MNTLYSAEYKILLIVIILSSFIFPQDSVLTELGRWGEGPCYVVRQIGNYIAVGNGSVLHILDFSDPSNPLRA